METLKNPRDYKNLRIDSNEMIPNALAIDEPLEYAHEGTVRLVVGDFAVYGLMKI